MPSTARTTDIAALALECGDRWVLGAVRDAHLSVARRAFAPTRGVGGRLPEQLHETLARAAYGSVSAGLRLAGSGARELSRRGVGRPVDSTTSGRRLRAALNGIAGDTLRAREDPHALPMTIRVGGRDVPPARWALRDAFPDATGHIVLLVHGLCQDDESWTSRAAPGAAYPERLRNETEGTPVVLRYNSGLPVAENGRLLADLVGELARSWPVRLSRVTVVGHQMGAVVARAALSHAVASHDDWTGLVRDVICLGSPRLGAPSEKAAQLATSVASGLARAGQRPRSLESIGATGGLRVGVVAGDTWTGDDVTARWARDRRALAPLPHAAYYFVAADDSQLGEQALLHHREVGKRLVQWLSARERHPRALPAR